MFLALSAVKLRHITAEALLCTTLFFFRVFTGIMEKKMETLGPLKGYIGVHKGYIGIMENEMETTII